MQITIDTSQPLSDSDQRLLATILNAQTEPAQPSRVVTEPAKVPAKAPAKTKPAPAPEPEPEVVEEPEEDLIGGGPTVQDAIDAATLLVNKGQGAKVKAALKAVGGDRVSNISADKAADFIAALEG